MTAYAKPRDLDEALALRSAHPDWVLLAGGTDLLVKAWCKQAPVGAIDLFGLPALCGVREQADGSLWIGAATTYASLIADAAIQTRAPMLVAAAREVGAMQIQARGTVGGNIGTSSPVGDTLPVWLALDAELELASVRGTRRVAYASYCTGYRQTELAADELIVAIVLPRLAAGTRQVWRKVGPRRAQSISKVMMAARSRTDAGGALREVRVAFGAVADRPIRLTAVEDVLEGQAPTAALAEAAAVAVAGAIHPIDDVRSTADYRLEVAQNLARRFVLDAS